MTGLSSSSEFHFVTQPTPTFYFIGVTTGKSAMMRLFPLWAQELGRPEVVIKGMDLKLHDTREAYRQAVAQIKYDPRSLGALVTTHKIDLLTATRDMFEYLDPYAILCDEVSSISKLDGRLEGHAKDPFSSGLSLDALVGEGYFARTCGEILCFGAGGSAVATALHLINKPDAADRPARFIVVNRSQGRLDSLREMVDKLGTDIAFEYICNQDPARNDALMAALAAGEHRHQRHGHGQGPPRLAHHRRRPLPARRHRLGVQLPRRAGLPAPGVGAGGRPGAARRGWLGLLPARLDAGDRPGFSYFAGRCAFRPAGGHCRAHPLKLNQEDWLTDKTRFAADQRGFSRINRTKSVQIRVNPRQCSTWNASSHRCPRFVSHLNQEHTIERQNTHHGPLVS